MTLEQALAALKQAQAENAALRADVARLTRMVERMTGQLDVLLEKLDEKRKVEDEKRPRKPPPPPPPPPDPDPPADGPPPAKPPLPTRHAHGRGPIPAHLPRATTTLQPESCPRCGGEHLREKDTEVTEVYDFVRAHIRTRRFERTICRCEDCLQPVRPLLPPLPFDRASCTVAMLAWVLYAKVGLHLPLERQQREFNAQGAPISSAMITRWYAEGADLLEGLYEALRQEALSRTHLQTDGTGLAVITPGGKKGTATVAGTVQVYCAQDLAVFAYAPSKEGKHIQDFLTLSTDPTSGEKTLWQGVLTADAANVLDFLFRDPVRVEGGCNAHGLRKFRDEEEKAPLLAGTALGYVRKLYAIERQAQAEGLTGEALLWRRQRDGIPVSHALRVWLELHLEDLLPSHPVRKAMQYYLNHWPALMRFQHDAAVPIDNNLSERLLRSVAVGRHNWVFAGGAAGAKRLCVVLSLVETCRLLGVEACGYLEWALQRVIVHPDNRGRRAVDLLPQAYQALQQREADEAGTGIGSRTARARGHARPLPLQSEIGAPA